MDLLHDSLRMWAQYREFKAILAELEGRSDAELARMGIGRGDIVRLAYEEAERRITTPVASAADAGAVLSVGGRYRARTA